MSSRPTSCFLARHSPSFLSPRLRSSLARRRYLVLIALVRGGCFEQKTSRKRRPRSQSILIEGGRRELPPHCLFELSAPRWIDGATSSTSHRLATCRSKKPTRSRLSSRFLRTSSDWPSCLRRPSLRPLTPSDHLMRTHGEPTAAFSVGTFALAVLENLHARGDRTYQRDLHAITSSSSRLWVRAS